MQALGVKEIVEHIEGRATLEEATATLVRNTKRFVRRQLSWFRADPRVRWVDASVAGWDGAREQIVRMYRAALPGVAG
jgi:tRNA dimethylallyltransferase